MKKDAKIYIAGATGMVGSAIRKKLMEQGYTNLIMRAHGNMDLCDPNTTWTFLSREKPEYIFLCAAKVGGIVANSTFPADFIHDNLMIQTNVIHYAHILGVKKLLFLGSSCIYPKLAEQPIKESQFMTGALEPTNEAYAIAKIAGIKMCQAYNKQYGSNFISVMPTNLYGDNDNYDLENSHVLPALIRKMHEAKEANTDVTLWGTGEAMREFMHADDLADACIKLMNEYDSSEIINIGTGRDISIKELAKLVAHVVGFKGTINWDTTKPNGTPRKLLDVSKLKELGYSYKISLYDGVKMAYDDFKKRF